MNKLQIYNASAGSGKTHQIAHEYLKLLFKNPDNYKHTLAITFTNKATAEMKERIIRELNLLSSQKITAHIDGIKEEKFNTTNEQVFDWASEMLNILLHDYSNISIATIDSFFQNILQGFFYELQYHSGFTIELDQDKILNEVTDQIINTATDNNDILFWLKILVNIKMDEGKDWDVSSDLKNLLKELFNEGFKKISNKLSPTISSIKQLKAHESGLKAVKAKFHGQIIKHAEVCLQIINKFGLEVNDFSGKKNGIGGVIVHIIEKTEGYSPHNKTWAKFIDCKEKWFTKTSGISPVTQQSVFDEINPLILKIYEAYLFYNTASIALKDFYVYGLLAEGILLLKKYREANHVLFISDVPEMIYQIIKGHNAPYLYEKVGSRYDHLIIDEFQDTSGFQWKNIKPLLENTLSEQNKLGMIVGDIKQSVYRWRGGDWKILKETVKNDILGIHEQDLNTNWRSKEEIINFNNNFFREMSGHLQALYEQEIHSPVHSKIITEAYQNCIQEKPTIGANLDGLVQINAFDEKSDDNWKESSLKQMCTSISQLLEKGYQYKDMAVLVRKNSDGKEVADMLLQHQIKVISNESLFLYSSTSVGICITALKLLLNPEDMVSLLTLVSKSTFDIRMVNDILSSNIKSNKDLTLKLHDLLPKKFSEEMSLLLGLPLYEMCEKISKIFGLENQEKELPYLYAFFDELSAYIDDQKNKAALSNFLEWWEIYGIKKSVKVNDLCDAIQITTVHKSKGLAYKIVFMPFCDWKLMDYMPASPPIMWARPKHTSFDFLNYMPVRFTKQMKASYFSEDYDEEMLNLYMDSFNLLYVAFTRAIDALYIHIPYKKNNTNLSNVSDMIYRYIDGTQDFFDTNIGCIEWKKGKLPVTLKNNSFENNNCILENVKTQESWTQAIRIKQYADEYFGMYSTHKNDIDFGNLIHDMLSYINTSQDVEAVVAEFIYRGLVKSEMQGDIKSTIMKLIHHPIAAQWFSENYEILKEKSILLQNEKVRRPDRVLIKGDQAIIIDFKTGTPSSSHIKQINTYMTLLQQMKYTQVKGYLAYLKDADWNMVAVN